MHTQRQENGVRNVLDDQGVIRAIIRPRTRLVNGRVRLVGFEAVGRGKDKITFPNVRAALKYLEGD